MMGVADNFTPDKMYGTFTLDAKLYQGDALVDQSSVTYDCQELDPALCPKQPDAIVIIGGSLAALVALAGLAYAARLLKKQPSASVM
jgi:hypothetical protein